MIQFPDPAPQYKFDPLNVDPWSDGAGAPTVVHPTGYPYDLIEELPRQSGASLPLTTQARGGAVHYKQSKHPGLDYPPIDRAFYFTANDNDVGLWGFWGEELDYAFKTITNSSSVKTELWTKDANDYLALVVQDNESAAWGYIADGQQNWRIRAYDDISKMELWANSTYASISIEGGQSLWTATGSGGRVHATTADLEGKTASFEKRVYVKNVELSCDGLEVEKIQSIFLVTPEEPPPDDEYTPPAHHCDHAKIHDIVHNALAEAGVHDSHGTHHEEHAAQHHEASHAQGGHPGHHGPAHNAGHSAGHDSGHGSHHGGHPSAHSAAHRAGHNNHHVHNHGSAHNAGHSAGHHSNHNNGHSNHHGGGHDHGSSHHGGGHSCCDHMDIDCQDGEITINGQ